jgi:hypothetical protein
LVYVGAVPRIHARTGHSVALAAAALAVMVASPAKAITNGEPDRGRQRVSVQPYVTNSNCAGVTYSQRVDIPEVLAWIVSFLQR